MFELLLPLFGTLLLLMFVLPPLPLFTTLLLQKQGATCQTTAKTTQHTQSVIARQRHVRRERLTMCSFLTYEAGICDH